MPRFKNNHVYFGVFRAETLAKKFKTPLYIYEADMIRRKYSEIIRNIGYPKLEIYYACKANTNITILKLLRTLGAKVETVSRGEIDTALKAGFAPRDILYTSTSVSKEELAFVARKRINVNLDSLSQIELYGAMRPGFAVGLRINQGIGAGHHSHVITGGDRSKFGIPVEHLKKALKIARKHGLKVVRLHQHIGSNVLDKKTLLKAFDRLLETASGFSDLEALDLGGGLGVRYSPSDKELDLSGFGRAITKRMNAFNKKYNKKLTMILEPGRFLVAESGTLLASVTEIKQNPRRTFVGLDTGFNHLVRPAMYGSYHPILNANSTRGKRIRADIVGNICESGDVFGRDRNITLPKEGDLVAILNTGAYGYAMASHFNTRPLPKEVMVDDGKARKI